MNDVSPTRSILQDAVSNPAYEARQRIRRQQWQGNTAGMAPGYVQGNLMILPQNLAQDFLLFCQRNP